MSVFTGFKVVGLLFIVISFTLVISEKAEAQTNIVGNVSKISQWIKQLGDDDYEKRDAAHQALIAIGDPAVPALKLALKSKDAEVVARATLVIDQIKNKTAKLRNDLRVKGRKAWNRSDKNYTVMAEVYPKLTKLSDPSWEDWQGLARVYEHQKKWKQAVGAYHNAVTELDVEITTPIDALVREGSNPILNSEGAAPIRGHKIILVGGRSGRISHYQALIDGQWVNVGGDMENVKRFVKQRRKHLPNTRLDLLMHIGQLEREKLNELLTAAKTFESVIDKTHPLWKMSLSEIAAQRAKGLRGEKIDWSFILKNQRQMSAWCELATTQQRMKPTAKTMETQSRLLFTCSQNFANSHYTRQRHHAEWLASMYLSQPMQKKPVAPLPLILLTPKKHQIKIDVTQPTEKLQPYCSYLTRNACIRWYAFVPPPGMAFETATIESKTSAKLIISVTRHPPDGKVNYQFRDYRRQLKILGDAKVRVKKIKFEKQTGLLIVEINNAAQVKDFFVDVTFRASETKSLKIAD